MKITLEEGHSLDEMEIVIRCSRLVIKKLPYGLRVLIFAATMLTVLSAIAVSFEWFPAAQLGQWIWLFAEFLISLLIVCLVSELRFRRKGNKYNKQLDKYRAKKQTVTPKIEEERITAPLSHHYHFLCVFIITEKQTENKPCNSRYRKICLVYLTCYEQRGNQHEASRKMAGDL